MDEMGEGLIDGSRDREGVIGQREKKRRGSRELLGTRRRRDEADVCKKLTKLKCL